MRADVLMNAGIDYDGGVKRFMGRTQLFEKLLAKFPGDTTFSRICADYQARDCENMLRDAHELKGMSANIALTRLSEAAGALVTLLRQSAYSQAELDNAYAALEQAYTATSSAIRTALEEPA